MHRIAPASLSTRIAGIGSSPVRDLLALTERPEVISFAGGLPAADFFDVDGMRAAYDAVLTQDGRRALQYSTTEGDPTLRGLIAERLNSAGLATDVDDLLVTTGSQQALTLLATTLVDPGDVVLVEDPGYLAALQCFSLAGARVVPVPTDDDGIIPEALADVAARERPKLLYLVPTFQNPTGRTLPIERRRAVAESAERLGFWIVEDDPYGELRYDGRPVPWIATIPEAGDRTALLGSFSKVVAPGLRIGYLRAPAQLRRACVIAKQAADLHTSTVDQAALAWYLTERDVAAHIERVRDEYRNRRDALLAGLPGALPAGSTWNRPAGGMFVWVRLADGLDASAVLPQAIRRDVAFVPGGPFYAGRQDRSALRMSFTAHPPEEIREGLRRLSGSFPVDARC
ncbi:PLP-dependent aminotransferase family protein [Gordonia neofelifaecis]|uniref:GntR family transcriptional regulator n=1 Tax=Gordonia neofelifaecis NRRL B-59395 TaxID=644548 RepID=F1YNM1_9ACTN|nr:PLP-dependent aminotransferase family protein [Gordonia neofelifaecis]EGD53758.1 GntR family transcriptional regulator [Gordonia neofelifaecis NRRL B-59395]